MSNTTSSNGGISFVGLLTIVFITLKLTGYIAWAWWWVLSPIWISIGLAFTIIMLFIVVGVALGGKPYIGKRR